jgi:hypothetical protein
MLGRPYPLPSRAPPTRPAAPYLVRQPSLWPAPPHPPNLAYRSTGLPPPSWALSPRPTPLQPPLLERLPAGSQAHHEAAAPLLFTLPSVVPASGDLAGAQGRLICDGGSFSLLPSLICDVSDLGLICSASCRTQQCIRRFDVGVLSRSRCVPDLAAPSVGTVR